MAGPPFGGCSVNDRLGKEEWKKRCGNIRNLFQVPCSIVSIGLKVVYPDSPLEILLKNFV